MPQATQGGFWKLNPGKARAADTQRATDREVDRRVAEEVAKKGK